MRRALKIVAVIVVINIALNAVALILRKRIPSIGDEESDEITLAAVARGIDLKSRARQFRGGSARAIMGGLRLDLRDATLTPPGARLDLQAIMGGVQVIVPPDWQVVPHQPHVILGGVDAPGSTRVEPDGRPRLELTTRAILGGVQVTAGPELT